MNNEIKLWNKLLSESPKGSVLMGGAVVDCMMNKKPKDYDIFYSYKLPAFVPSPNWKMTGIDFNDPVWVAEHAAWYQQGIDADGNNPIMSVTEYKVDDKYLVQLIGVKYADPREHMKNFDHSLTLGRYDHHGLFIHRKCIDADLTKTIKYINKNKDPVAVARSFTRAARKAIKYGGDWKYEGFL